MRHWHLSLVVLLVALLGLSAVTAVQYVVADEKSGSGLLGSDSLNSGSSDSSDSFDDSSGTSDSSFNEEQYLRELQLHQAREADHDTIVETTFSDATSQQESAEELSDIPVTPEVRVEVNGDSKDLHGDRHIDVKVEHAGEVEVVLVRPGGLTEFFLGNARQRDDDSWRLGWRTTQTPNGEYQIIAKVTNVYGTYDALGPRVIVRNEVDEEVHLENQPPLSEDIRREIHERLSDSLAEQGLTLEDLEEQFVSVLEDVGDIRVVETLPLEIDSDGDGLTDDEELRLGSDPFNPDTDGDGFIDGLEVARGYSPLIPSPGDKVAFTQPTENIGEVRSDVYGVETITVTDTDDQEELVIKGRGRPLAFATIYIYSEIPIVVTVRADENGNFEYVLQKTLADGDHRVYIALTDTNGLIVEKSEPFAFVKEAQAITLTDATAAAVVPPVVTPESPLQPNTIVLLTLGIVLAAIVLMVLIMSFVLRKRQTEGVTPPNQPKLE